MARPRNAPGLVVERLDRDPVVAVGRSGVEVGLLLVRHRPAEPEHDAVVAHVALVRACTARQCDAVWQGDQRGLVDHGTTERGHRLIDPSASQPRSASFCRVRLTVEIDRGLRRVEIDSRMLIRQADRVLVGDPVQATPQIAQEVDDGFVARTDGRLGREAVAQEMVELGEGESGSERLVDRLHEQQRLGGGLERVGRDQLEGDQVVADRQPQRLGQ